MTVTDLFKISGVCLSRVVSAVVVAACLQSCGGESGSWEDDPGNWGRAFDGVPPADVTVIHSRYLKAPYCFPEVEYFFQIKCPANFVDDWIRKDDLEKVPPVEDTALDDPRRPVWFIPGPIQNYEIWMSSSDSDDPFRIYREKASGMVYLTDGSR